MWSRPFASLFPAASLLAASLLAGCATDGGARFPSLAPRPVERLGFAEPSRPVAPVVTDPALDTAIAAQGAALTRLAAGYDAAAATAQRRVGAAGVARVGSDPWLAGQAALAALDDWRARTTALAVAIEQQASVRAARLDPPYPALQALIERAAAETQRQSAVSNRLQAALPPA